MEEFEHMDHHLKESLDGLSLQPKITSFDAVLKKMAAKKRRRILFWWLIPGILITGGVLAYLGFESNHKSQYSDLVPKTPALQGAETKSHTSNAYAPDARLKMSKSKFNAQKQKVTPPPQTLVAKSPHKNQIRFAKQTSQTKNSLQINPSSGVSETSADFSSELKNVGVNDSSVSFEYLLPLDLVLPLEEKDLESGQISENSIASVDPDSLTKEKKSKRIQFIWGPHLDPQAGSNLFAVNTNSDYDKTLAKTYSEQRWKNNTVNFNYHLGLKMGLILRDKWEFLAGLGFQKFTNSEKITSLLPVLSFANNYNQAVPASTSKRKESVVPASYGQTYNNSFNYLSYKLEASKYVSWRRFTKMKIGCGLQLNQLLWANTVIVGENNDYSYYRHTRSGALRKWTSILDFKLGFIHDLNSRTQFQFCPAVFCAPNSMFVKSYLVKQRPFGFSLECLLLFKLGN